MMAGAGRGLLRIAGISENSVVDGPGIRFTVFVQGCSHRCQGCHNPSTWDRFGGCDVSVTDLWKKIRNDRLVTGVTFSGGEPFDQQADLMPLAACIRTSGMGLWIYTGYLFDDIVGEPLASMADVIVDGPYVESKRSLELPFRGSRNQRIVDVPASVTEGRVVEWAG